MSDRVLDRCFSKARRLLSKADFARLQKRGKKLYCSHLMVVMLDSEGSESRLGVTVSRKVSTRAVVRNRIKRRLREIFRLSREQLCRPFDIVIVARNNAAECDYSQLRKEFLGCLHHHGFLKAKTTAP